MKENILLISLFIFLQTAVFSQDSTSIEPAVRKYQFIPSIGAGVGYSKFFGDISDKGKTNVHFLGNRFSYDVTLSGNLSNSFYINLNAIIGKLSGNENSQSLHRNFETSMMNLGANLEYNFGGLYKKKRPVLTPYISVGFYYNRFSSGTDLYDVNGNLYYYWSDGKIRNVAEDDIDSDNAERLSRDYAYETKLHTSPVSAFSVPVGAGLDFHIGKRMVFRFNSKYFFAFSDELDGTILSGNNDGFLYNSVSVLLNLVPDKTNYLSKELQRELDAEDYDGDGVMDFEDECGGTPSAVTVGKQGCPVDKDTDGIPDYLDKEPNSVTMAVGVDGVQFDFFKIAQNAADSISILHAVLQKYPNLFLKSGIQNFTVYVGVFNQTNSAQKIFLKSIQGIKEKQINDSLFVYSVGDYKEFNEAEKGKNEMQQKGIDNAFEVSDGQLANVASELGKIMPDNIETPEQKKVKQDEQIKILETASANTKNKEGEFVTVSALHSDDKKDFTQKESNTEKEPVKAGIKSKENKLVVDKIEEIDNRPLMANGTLTVEKKSETNNPEKDVVEVKSVNSEGGLNEEKKPEIINKKTEVVEEKKVEAAAVIREEKKPEYTADEVEKKVEQMLSASDAPENKKTSSKDVVKFKVDIVEHSDKALPFNVLLIMQREGFEIQTSRLMNAKIYVVGNYDTVKNADKIKTEIAGFGVSEITIVGSVNGINVTQKEAEDLLNNTGK